MQLSNAIVTISLFLGFFLVVPTVLRAQEVRFIDNKGSIQYMNVGIDVTIGNTAPVNPEEGDIWFDTSAPNNQKVKIWDQTSWVELTFTGQEGSVFFADNTGAPAQDNANFFWDSTNNRLGVGTNVPTQALDVNGQLRVRTLNTAAASDNHVKVDPNGVFYTSKVNYGGRWTNVDTATNLNVDDVLVPIFGSADYVDDGTNLYEATSATSLTVKETGRYDIRVNLSLFLPDVILVTETNDNVAISLAVNGTEIGALGYTGLITGSNGNRSGSVHLNEILQLNANDVVTIVTTREANLDEVNFEAAGTSSFAINKIK